MTSETVTAYVWRNVSFLFVWAGWLRCNRGLCNPKSIQKQPTQINEQTKQIKTKQFTSARSHPRPYYQV